MSDYELRPGGSLKLKGGVAEGGIKKKKKKSKSKSGVDIDAARERRRMEELLFEEHEATLKSDTPSGSGRNSPSISGGGTKKTEAERRFEETKKQRLAQRVAKLAGMTHKDRVAEFNNHLESLSEHHDIPKVGPG